MEDINRSEFIKGRGGREKSFIRTATTNERPDDTLFHSGGFLYPAKPATPTERKILAMGNAILDLQSSILHSLAGDSDPIAFPRNRVNTIHIIIEVIQPGSGYGLHSDYGDLINSHGLLSKAPCGENIHEGRRLPYQEEMQTLTLVLTSLPDEAEDEATHELTFHDSEGKLIGKIATTGNMVHFQMHGTQCFRHKVTKLSNINFDFAKYTNKAFVRTTFSLRDAPQLDRNKSYGTLSWDNISRISIPIEEYRNVNVRAAMETCSQPYDTLHDSE
jgi:hypothetical protein